MNNTLKGRVMRRIYLEYFKNIFINYADYILPLSFTGILFAFVSVPNVLINMPKDNIYNTLNFLLAAIRDTHTTVQLLLALMSIWSCVFLSRIALKISWKKLDLLRGFGLLRIRY